MTRQNPHAGEFYFTLAASWTTRNKQAEAETFFREAMRVMPQHIGPPSHLGLLYMRMGREDEARKVLEAAFKADPFNVRVKNMLEVLDVLDAMATYPSRRFVLKYDARATRNLPARPPNTSTRSIPNCASGSATSRRSKPVIEIFSRAGGHSGQRVVRRAHDRAAVPGHGGGQHGPHGGDGLAGRAAAAAHCRLGAHAHARIGPRHHAAADAFQLPALVHRGAGRVVRRRPAAQGVERTAPPARAERPLFNLDTLNFGFTRPESSDDWQLAYCQAELYVEYMLERAGADREACLRKLLACYAEGLATPTAIERVFGVSQAEFEAGYLSFLKKQAARIEAVKEKNKQ